MTATHAGTLTATDEETRRLIDSLTRNLMREWDGDRTGGTGGTATQAGVSRDSGAVVGAGTPATAPPAGAEPADQDAQRMFGAFLQSVIPAVIPKLVPLIHGILQQRRRDLGLPEQRDAAAVERDFGSILSALLPKLIEATPGIIAAVTARPAPRDAQQEDQRFLPLLGMLVPAVLSAVPGIIGAFDQQRGVDTAPPPLTDPDVAQRFLGPLLSSFVPQLLQAAPGILSAAFPSGGRSVPSSAAW